MKAPGWSPAALLWPPRACELALLGAALCASCSSDGGATGVQGFDPDESGADMDAIALQPGGGSGGDSGGGAGTGGAPGTEAESGFSEVGDLERPPGMPIGQGASGPDDGSSSDEASGEGDPAAADASEPEEIEIPVFEAPVEDLPPPCSGCVELNMDVDDINQRDDFVFDAGGVTVSRVVWTLLIPFNSDQLFVQPFVGGSYGQYTQLHVNAFPLNTPVQFVHEYSGNAGQVGIALGSSGAWTGDMRMAVFVDSVTLEGANGASRTFDMSAEGLAARSNAHAPGVVYHP